MKICPVCSARCFDDMEVCFGCLHVFSTDRNEVVDFDPAPASEDTIRQTIERSTERMALLPSPAISKRESKGFAVSVSLEYPDDEHVEARIRMPSRMLKELVKD